MGLDPSESNQHPISKPKKRTEHALMGLGGRLHEWIDETMKETTFWKAPAGNYVLKFETR